MDRDVEKILSIFEKTADDLIAKGFSFKNGKWYDSNGKEYRPFEEREYSLPNNGKRVHIGPSFIEYDRFGEEIRFGL